MDACIESSPQSAAAVAVDAIVWPRRPRPPGSEGANAPAGGVEKGGLPPALREARKRRPLYCTPFLQPCQAASQLRSAEPALQPAQAAETWATSPLVSTSAQFSRAPRLLEATTVFKNCIPLFVNRLEKSPPKTHNTTTEGVATCDPPSIRLYNRSARHPATRFAAQRVRSSNRPHVRTHETDQDTLFTTLYKTKHKQSIRGGD